jgi:hypothetical protein
MENAENAKKNSCEFCDFTCSKQSDWSRHIVTRKHHLAINGNIMEMKKNAHSNQCDICSKYYKTNSGLWKHKKHCFDKVEEEELTKDHKIDILIKENTDFKNIILDLMKNNGDIQKQMFDVCKNGINTINNNNSNNNNKTFNMQVFLNEKCKDAMNIMDFVNSMTLQLSDLEDVGELGYVEGISKIMIKKLNEMDVYKRPIHCSDYKREVMYVRDDDIWEKENSTFDKIRKAIKYITKKNGDLMIPWRDKHPLCMNTTHRLNDVYLRIMNQSMGGKGEFADSENKIIKKLSKAVYIDKNDY